MWRHVVHGQHDSKQGRNTSGILQCHEWVDTSLDERVHVDRLTSEEIFSELRVGCSRWVDILLKAGFILKVVSECLITT